MDIVEATLGIVSSNVVVMIVAPMVSAVVAVVYEISLIILSMFLEALSNDVALMVCVGSAFVMYMVVAGFVIVVISV